MRGLVQTVQRWQGTTALTPAQTTLIGFSQGAIIACESTQLDVLRQLASWHCQAYGALRPAPAQEGWSEHLQLGHQVRIGG